MLWALYVRMAEIQQQQPLKELLERACLAMCVQGTEPRHSVSPRGVAQAEHAR